MTTIALPVATASTLAPAAKDTTVGNYFVANYPPFGFWKPEHAPALTEALTQPPHPGVELGLYVHIPFCRKRCHFCYFRVYTDKNAQQIRGYIDAVHKELATYADTALIRGRRPDFIYFGGGTPSYLSPDQLRALTDGMKRVLPWDDAREVSFEAEPGTLNATKLRTLREIGVTRLSLGIEHMDDHVLDVNGRAHRSKEVHVAYGHARELGFDNINVDLIAGMVEETDDKWADTVDKTLALGPDAVTIYQMEVPYNSTIYQRMKAQGQLVAPVADWDTKRRWVEHAFATFTAAGYTVASATTVVKDPRKPYLYRKGLFDGTDLLSVGVSSFGHLRGINYQNLHDFDPYVNAVQTDGRAVFRAYPLSPDERYIRELGLQLKSGSVSTAAFAAKFGRDPREQFPDVIARWQDQGLIAQHGDRLVLSRHALMRVDRLIFDLFRPEHRTGRYA